MSLLKINKDIVLPISLIVEQLSSDMALIDAEVFTFSAVSNSYPYELYNKLCYKGLVNYEGRINNFCKLTDGMIYDGSSYNIYMWQVKKLKNRFSKCN